MWWSFHWMWWKWHLSVYFWLLWHLLRPRCVLLSSSPVPSSPPSLFFRWLNSGVARCIAKFPKLYLRKFNFYIESHFGRRSTLDLLTNKISCKLLVMFFFVVDYCKRDMVPCYEPSDQCCNTDDAGVCINPEFAVCFPPLVCAVGNLACGGSCYDPTVNDCENGVIVVKRK